MIYEEDRIEADILKGQLGLGPYDILINYK